MYQLQLPCFADVIAAAEWDLIRYERGIQMVMSTVGRDTPSTVIQDSAAVALFPLLVDAVVGLAEEREVLLISVHLLLVGTPSA